MSNPTPGPWKVADDDPYEVISEDWGGIAMVPNEPAEVEPLMEMARANARLIAAAPALLEALEAIRELAREDVRGPSLVEAWFDEFDALMPQVDAALALANGTEEVE